MSRPAAVSDLGAVDYWLGLNTLVVRARVPHGKGTRDIDVAIDPRLVVALGKAFEGCTTAEERAHALYHLQYPSVPVPCSSCARCPHPPEQRRDGNYCLDCRSVVDA